MIISTLIAVVAVYFIEKKIPYIPLIGATLISIFGGLSLYFNDPIFLYIKPTIINIIFALTLLIGNIFFKVNFLKFFFKNAFQLNDVGWAKLNNRWAFFFLFLAILNELIWRTQSEAMWVNFKVWGIIPLTFIFTALQLPLIKKYRI